MTKIPKYINKYGDADVLYADNGAYEDSRSKRFVSLDLVELSWYKVWWGSASRAYGETRFEHNILGLKAAEELFNKKCLEVFDNDRYQLKRQNNLAREYKRLMKSLAKS